MSDRRFLHADHQGSIIGASDATGFLLGAPYPYGPYGEPASWTGPRFRYTGQIALPEAQLHHYKARVYDPLLGRFLQTDPVGYTDDLNLYAYVRNDPLNHSDPTGRSCTVTKSDKDGSSVASCQIDSVMYRDARGRTQVRDATAADHSVMQDSNAPIHAQSIACSRTRSEASESRSPLRQDRGSRRASVRSPPRLGKSASRWCEGMFKFKRTLSIRRLLAAEGGWLWIRLRVDT